MKSGPARIRSLVLCGCALAVLLAAAPATAQPIAGIKATVTGVDVGLLSADIDLTAYVTPAYPYTTVWVGFGTTGGGFVPAVEWGDGSTVPPYGYGPFTGIPVVTSSTVVNGQTVDIYRGSFSHVYPAEGEYTIRVNSVESPTTPLITGSVATYNTIPYVTNTTDVRLRFIVTEIPTATEVGLLLLALALAGAAIYILRR